MDFAHLYLKSNLMNNKDTLKKDFLSYRSHLLFVYFFPKYYETITFWRGIESLSFPYSVELFYTKVLWEQSLFFDLSYFFLVSLEFCKCWSLLLLCWNGYQTTMIQQRCKIPWHNSFINATYFNEVSAKLNKISSTG